MSDCEMSIAMNNPEQFFNIPLEDRFALSTPTEIRELQKEWVNSYDGPRKFNIQCRVLGKILKFVKTESHGYHLNTCGFFLNFSYCEAIINNLRNYFAHDELHWYFKNCAR